MSDGATKESGGGKKLSRRDFIVAAALAAGATLETGCNLLKSQNPEFDGGPITKDEWRRILGGRLEHPSDGEVIYDKHWVAEGRYRVPKGMAVSSSPDGERMSLDEEVTIANPLVVMPDYFHWAQEQEYGDLVEFTDENGKDRLARISCLRLAIPYKGRVAFAWLVDPHDSLLQVEGEVKVVTGAVEFRSNGNPTVNRDGSWGGVGAFINPDDDPPPTIRPWYCTAMAFGEKKSYLLKIGEIIPNEKEYLEAVRQNPNDFNVTGILGINNADVRNYYWNDQNPLLPEGYQ